jgi:hypothetical protein
VGIGAHRWLRETRLTDYSTRKRENEDDGSFASRNIDHLPQEITSRVRSRG